MRDAEAAVFDILERELKRLPFRDARCQRRPIDPAIARHPAFSKLHFTKTPERPGGLSPEETYAERGNLLYLVDGVREVDGAEVSEGGLALNAHIDVVAPFFPPRVENGVVFGRGTCDDKGNVVAMIGALRAVAETLADEGRTPRVPLTAMIVVEEETGGNGSLSLALDRKLRKRYDTLLVLECCENRIYPANRGAVWYKFEVRAAEHGLNGCLPDRGTRKRRPSDPSRKPAPPVPSAPRADLPRHLGSVRRTSQPHLRSGQFRSAIRLTSEGGRPEVGSGRDRFRGPGVRGTVRRQDSANRPGDRPAEG
ncbi:MAG: M20 family metallopeptidase [Planctomycetes bacterium]|nr:M20 family metallopeptidase [Planctomycetota bacterium]